MIRVLGLLTDLFEATGGIQTFNRTLAKALDEIATERDWTVNLHVLNDRGGSLLQPRYLASGRTRYVPFEGRRAAFALASASAAQRADLVLLGHVHFAPLLHAMRLIQPTLKAYLIVYGIEVWKRLSWPRRTGALRADRVLAVSAATADWMARDNGIPPERFSVLPLTVDPFYRWNGSPAWSSRGELGLPSGPMILSVSRLDVTDRDKRIDLVIEAMPAVLEQVPDAFYVVVGGGTDRTRLEEVAGAMGVRDRVYFIGRVPDERLPAYYQCCDVFALPSEQEGFGIVFLEAMAHAKPCVGVRAGGVPEVIEHGSTGFLADPSDVRGVARIIVRLLRDERLLEAVGRAGRARMERLYSFERFRGRLDAALGT
jgi:phosphatidyl-myo-inositol dimannoside synthase